MGRRHRQRERLSAPSTDYEDAEGNVLTLRGSMTTGTRETYRAALAGSSLSREDAWHRAVELLFERLTVRWTVSGLPIERQNDLLARFRFASELERAWIRGVLREHVAEHFPELPAP